MFPITALLEVGAKLIDKLIPDPEAKAHAQLELAWLWPVITKSKAPMTDYEKWSGVAAISASLVPPVTA